MVARDVVDAISPPHSEALALEFYDGDLSMLAQSMALSEVLHQFGVRVRALLAECPHIGAEKRLLEDVFLARRLVTHRAKLHKKIPRRGIRNVETAGSS